MRAIAIWTGLWVLMHWLI